VVSETLGGVEGVSFGLYFPTGSRHETPENNGISHFIEHLVFKGTPSRTADEINREIDLLGGGANAFTSKETLCLHARVLSEHLPRLVDLFGDLAVNALPEGVEQEVDREREVILSEISAVEDSPEDLVGDLCDRAYFGEHPLALPVVGSVRAVRRLALGEIRAHFAHHIVAGNLVVAAAGKVEHEQLVRLARDRLGGLPTGEPPAGPPAPEPRPATRREPRDLEQVHVCLSARGLSRADARRPAAELLSVILGEGFSSRLFREVRDRRGLAYSIYTGLASYADGGSLGIYFGTAPEKLSPTLDVVGRVLREVRGGDISADELEAAKLQVRTATLLAGESSGARMAHLAEQVLLGSDELELQATLRAFERVSLDEVRELAAALLEPPLAIAAVGPVGDDVLPRSGWDLGA
jgi:predicted Zn-dependent peptidase